MNQPDVPRQDEIHEILAALDRRVRRLTLVAALMALALLLLAASVFGSLVNYFGGDAMLFGGASVGAALLGFAAGWFARQRT